MYWGELTLTHKKTPNYSASSLKFITLCKNIIALSEFLSICFNSWKKINFNKEKYCEYIQLQYFFLFDTWISDHKGWLIQMDIIQSWPYVISVWGWMENSLTRNTLPNQLQECHDEGTPCGGHTNKCFPTVVCSNKFKCTEGKGHASCFMSFSNICGPSAWTSVQTGSTAEFTRERTRYNLPIIWFYWYSVERIKCYN